MAQSIWDQREQERIKFLEDMIPLKMPYRNYVREE
jgi:hypothetical protein